MLIHQYDNLTGQYLSSRLADEDPRHPGRWMLPAFSTADALPERQTQTWPFYREGAWALLPDWRGRVLYRRDTGEPAEILIAGVTPEESGLTPIPKPSDKHVWGDGKWVVDPAAVAAEKRDEAMAEFERRLHLAKSHNVGKADALAAGLLTDEEVYYFKAWSNYQMDLVRTIESPTFPDDFVWPSEPVPYVPIEAQHELITEPSQ